MRHLSAGDNQIGCVLQHGITNAVLQREVGGLPDSPHYRRLLMNLGNLRKMLSIRASLDCIAYEDGEFDGRDRGDAYARIGEEREGRSRPSLQLNWIEHPKPGCEVT